MHCLEETVMRKSRLLGALFAALSTSFLPLPVHAIAVDLELALVLDISGSVNKDEYILQRDGYVNAFLDPAIQGAIASKPDGIAVSLSPGTLSFWLWPIGADRDSRT